MTRKPIEPKAGAIAPVTHGLWGAALEKLAEARVGIAQMESAKDRVTYESGWTRFVDSLEEFWSRFFDEGKRAFSAFQPWAGALDAGRRADDMLNYIIQARHQSQHGRISLSWTEGRLHIAPGFSGHLQGVRMYSDGTFDIDAIPAPGSTVEAKVVHNPGDPHLPAIENRKWGNSFTPPAAHLGLPLADPSPITVARLAIRYYDDVLKEASQRFSLNP